LKRFQNSPEVLYLLHDYENEKRLKYIAPSSSLLYITFIVQTLKLVFGDENACNFAASAIRQNVERQLQRLDPYLAQPNR